MLVKNLNSVSGLWMMNQIHILDLTILYSNNIVAMVWEMIEIVKLEPTVQLVEMEISLLNQLGLKMLIKTNFNQHY